MGRRKKTFEYRCLKWAKLPGIPRQMMWPVKKTAVSHNRIEVYCHADNMVFSVKPDDLEPFPGQFSVWKERGIQLLKKKKKTLEDFKKDIEWALLEAKEDVLHSHSDTTTSGPDHAARTSGTDPTTRTSGTDLTTRTSGSYPTARTSYSDTTTRTAETDPTTRSGSNPTTITYSDPTTGSSGSDLTTRTLGSDPTTKNLGLDTTTRKSGSDYTTSTSGSDPTTETLKSDPTTGKSSSDLKTGTLGSDPTPRSSGSDTTNGNSSSDPTTSTSSSDPTTSTSGSDPTTETSESDPTTEKSGSDPATRSSGSDHTTSTSSSDPTTSTMGSDPTTGKSGSDLTTRILSSDTTTRSSGSDTTTGKSGSDHTTSTSGSDPTAKTSESDPITRKSGSDLATGTLGSDPTTRSSVSDTTTGKSGSDHTTSTSSSDPPTGKSGSDLTTRILGSDTTTRSSGSDTTTGKSGSNHTTSTSGSDPTTETLESDPATGKSGSDLATGTLGSDPTTRSSVLDTTTGKSGSDHTTSTSSSDPTTETSESDPTTNISSSDPKTRTSGSDPTTRTPGTDHTTRTCPDSTPPWILNPEPSTSGKLDSDYNSFLWTSGLIDDDAHTFLEEIDFDNTELDPDFEPDSTDEEDEEDTHPNITKFLMANADEDVDGSYDSDDNELSSTDVEECQITRDITNRNIFIRRILKTEKGSKGQAKKKTGLRVYNSYHACFVCGKLVQHIPMHLRTHRNNIQVKTIMRQDKPDFSVVRKLGDHLHNMKVIESGKGEMLLSRRPHTLDVSLYGPCPNCKDWVLLKSIKYHHKNCIKNSPDSIPLSKRSLYTQSMIMAGHMKLDCEPSSIMTKEVFQCMTDDKITKVAQNDALIMALGESWLRRNIDNLEKRKYYSSQRMRLCARLLLQLQQLDKNNSQGNCMSYYLQPKYFDLVTEAAIQCCMPFMEDIEELKSPTNAIKLKYDLKRLVDAKWAMNVKGSSDALVVKDCKTFLKLMEVEWKEKVTRFARAVLARRSFLHTYSKELPAPEDISTLTLHLVKELKETPLNKRNYYRLVQLCQVRLLLFNKRRAGELEVIKLSSYASRTSKLSDIDESLIHDLTEVEKYLMKSQELITIRGKRCRPVPVIIPSDTLKPLNWISLNKNRTEAGVLCTNQYLFPNTVNLYARAYSSLKQVCAECKLIAPSRISSVTLRKYTATLTQMMNLDKNEMEWLCKHLGHTTDVHKEHYRQMSGLVERVYVSKLLLVQDLNLTHKFKGRNLAEIDLKEILQQADPQLEDADSTQNLVQEHGHSVQKHGHDESDIEEMEIEHGGTSDEESVEEDLEDEPPRKKRKEMNFTRQRWTEEECREINFYFKSYLETKTTPRGPAIEKAKTKSKANNGKIHLRENHLIVKKISNMNHK